MDTLLGLYIGSYFVIGSVGLSPAEYNSKGGIDGWCVNRSFPSESLVNGYRPLGWCESRVTDETVSLICRGSGYSAVFNRRPDDLVVLPAYEFPAELIPTYEPPSEPGPEF